MPSFIPYKDFVLFCHEYEEEIAIVEDCPIDKIKEPYLKDLYTMRKGDFEAWKTRIKITAVYMKRYNLCKIQLQKSHHRALRAWWEYFKNRWKAAPSRNTIKLAMTSELKLVREFYDKYL